MNESIHKYMKPGLIHFMAYPEVMGGEGPILETLAEIAHDADFTAVEIAHVNDADERRQVRDLCATAGLTVAYAAQPTILSQGLNPNSLDEEERREAAEALAGEMQMAAEIGAGGMAILSGPDPGDADRPTAIDAMARTCRALCDRGAELGLNLALETFDRDIDKKALIGPSADAVALAKAVDRENFGLLVDLSHLPLQHETAREALGAVRDYLVHAHLGNCVMQDPSSPAYGDMHPRFGYPGGENGVPEVAEFLQALLDIGFLTPDAPPIVSFEVKPQQGETSRAVVANAKRVLRQAWARV